VIFSPKLTANTNILKLNLFNTYSSSLQPIGVSVQIQTLDHIFPNQIFNGGSKSSCSGKFHPLKVHSALFFPTPTLDFFFRLSSTGAFHRAFDSY
jgi:hypothetical protein